MEEVQSARLVDDTHMRWTTKIGSHSRDWDSEIIEQQPDRCPAGTMTEATQPGQQQSGGKSALDQSMDLAVPKSD